MSARALLEQLHSAWPCDPPVFRMSSLTQNLLQARAEAGNERALTWTAGLEALGARIEIDENVEYGMIAKDVRHV